jgi:Na+-driven multidrug efflux pump
MPETPPLSEAEEEQEEQEEEEKEERQDDRDMSYGALVKKSVPAIANEASRPLAALVLVALVGSAPCLGDGQEGGCEDDGAMLAAYAAVTATVSFASALCNFMLTVTTAQVGKDIGQKRWSVVGARVRIAAGVSFAVGIVCAALLFCATESLFAGMGLTTEVIELATPFMYWRLATVPLVFLLTSAGGVLSGYKRFFASAAVSFAVALTEVMTAYIALYINESGLVGLGAAGFIAAGAGFVLAATVAGALPPDEAPTGAIVIVPVRSWCSGGMTEYADLNDEDRHYEGSSQAEQGISTKDILHHYLRDSKDQMIRSLALHTSVYAMAVGAAQLGTAPLAAHQIVMSLWMLSSYVCDGFGVVGTSLGSDMYGAGHSIGNLSVKLIILGSSCGALCGMVLFIFSDSVIGCFTSHRNVVRQLDAVWWMLCIMQPTNGAVFVLDGLLAALQAFKFAAKAMVGSVALLFFPALLIGNFLAGDEDDDGTIGRGLAVLWAAKCVLNLARFLSAGWYVQRKHDPTELASEEIGRHSSVVSGQEAGEDPTVWEHSEQGEGGGAVNTSSSSPAVEPIIREMDHNRERKMHAKRLHEEELATYAELDSEHAELAKQIAHLSPVRGSV